MKICGIDEAGRGCVAGSLFVCGVACDDAALSQIAGIADSKQLSRKKRDKIYEIALAQAIPHFVVQFSANEIDERGIAQCIANALTQITQNLAASVYLFDGNTNFGARGVECVVKGDSKIAQISLASIIAKSLKDRESDALHALYPQYDFAKHKGYGTSAHIEAIKTHGFSPAHRKTFKIKALEATLF